MSYDAWKTNEEIGEYEDNGYDEFLDDEADRARELAEDRDANPFDYED